MASERLSRLQRLTLIAIGTDTVAMARGYAYRDMVAQTVFEYFYGWPPNTPLKYGQDKRFTASFSRSLKNLEQKGWIERHRDVEALKLKEADVTLGYWTPRTLILTTCGKQVLKEAARGQPFIPLVSPGVARTTPDARTANASGDLNARDRGCLMIIGKEGEAGNQVAEQLLRNSGTLSSWLKLARMALGERME